MRGEATWFPELQKSNRKFNRAPGGSEQKKKILGIQGRTNSPGVKRVGFISAGATFPSFFFGNGRRHRDSVDSDLSSSEGRGGDV